MNFILLFVCAMKLNNQANLSVSKHLKIINCEVRDMVVVCLEADYCSQSEVTPSYELNLSFEESQHSEVFIASITLPSL